MEEYSCDEVEEYVCGEVEEYGCGEVEEYGCGEVEEYGCDVEEEYDCGEVEEYSCDGLVGDRSDGSDTADVLGSGDSETVVLLCINSEYCCERHSCRTPAKKRQLLCGTSRGNGDSWCLIL